MRTLSDKELMFLVRDGDLDKLSLLFERYHKMLYNFFLRMTGRIDVSEDLVQDVFFRILKYRQTYRGDSLFNVWIFKIARNARIDYFRKRKIESSGDDANELASHDLNPREGFEEKEATKLLHTALARLQEDDREVLLLSRFENMKYKEIAGLLGCPEGTVKARVHRAIKRLRDIFFELSGEVI